MGLVLKCMNLMKEYGERRILEDVSFYIQSGERVALVGDNGSGKTTIANIITGIIEADGGSIKWHDKVKIGYLHQSTYYTQEDFMEMALDRKNGVGDFLQRTSELGVKSVDKWENERLKNLSGGERTKLSLAKIWAENPQFLILDEPTNHMDYEGIQWLIEEVDKYRGTLMIISHDRYFMDKIAERIIELQDGKCLSYSGNYTDYKNEKNHRYKSQLKEYENCEKYKKEIQENIKSLKEWSEKGHRESTKKKQVLENKMGGKEKMRARVKKKDNQVKSHIKRLEKIELEGVKKPKEEQKITFNFLSEDKVSKRIVQGKNLKKSYGDNTIFEKSSFYVQRGERVCLFGKNGCGKTTLIKNILGQETVDKGSLYLTPSAKVGYLSQDVMDLNGEKTVLEIFNIENYEKRGKLQTLLTNMGFSKAMMYEKVEDLSLGERTRIKLAYLILNENNVLILDEPTNHLDLHSREMLEKTLMEYEGTIIIVSHDRYLLQKLCNKVLVFQEKRIRRLEYSFQDYMDRMNADENQQKEMKKKKDELMIIENEIATVIGEMSMISSEGEKYQELKGRFTELVKKKKKLQS